VSEKRRSGLHTSTFAKGAEPRFICGGWAALFVALGAWSWLAVTVTGPNLDEVDSRHAVSTDTSPLAHIALELPIRIVLQSELSVSLVAGQLWPLESLPG